MSFSPPMEFNPPPPPSLPLPHVSVRSVNQCEFIGYQVTSGIEDGYCSLYIIIYIWNAPGT